MARRTSARPPAAIFNWTGHTVRRGLALPGRWLRMALRVAASLAAGDPGNLRESPFLTSATGI